MKKFITNKNVVTILALILLALTLFVFYGKRVNDAIAPITVPYAKVDIPAGVKITSDMVGTRNVSRDLIDASILTTMSSVVNKYSSSDTEIPKGSLFYDRSVSEKEEIPANIIFDVKKGHVLYNMPVNTSSTYGNSIYPGNYIDIYLKAKTSDMSSTKTGKNVLLGKLVENVEVVAVKDAKGRSVFNNLDEQREPAYIVFSLPEDMYIMLKKASFLRSYQSELIPVPTNESLKDTPGELKISNEDLKNWVNQMTVFELD